MGGNTFFCLEEDSKLQLEDSKLQLESSKLQLEVFYTIYNTGRKGAGFPENRVAVGGFECKCYHSGNQS